MIVHINAGQAALVRTMATSGARLEWGELIQRTAPDMHTDNFAPLLAERLAAMIRAGIDAHGLLTAAIASGTLPDDHAAAALWWRISRHLSPAEAEPINADHTPATPWTPMMAQDPPMPWLVVGAPQPTQVAIIEPR